jgi:hypothetical protein
VEIAFGLKLQFNISVETEGGVEVTTPPESKHPTSNLKKCFFDDLDPNGFFNFLNLGSNNV